MSLFGVGVKRCGCVCLRLTNVRQRRTTTGSQLATMQSAIDAFGGHGIYPCNKALQSELEYETEIELPSSSVSTNNNEQPRETVCCLRF